MEKIWLLGMVLFLLVSCKEEADKEITVAVQEEFINIDSLPRPIAVNAKAEAILKNWQAFYNMETTFESLYRVENREDLSLVIDDLLEKQKQLEASTYPEIFDKPQIKSRLIVLHTFILKTKGNLEYRMDTKETTLDMIAAYNAYRNQFNVLVNSELDTSLILNE